MQRRQVPSRPKAEQGQVFRFQLQPLRIGINGLPVTKLPGKSLPQCTEFFNGVRQGLCLPDCLGVGNSGGKIENLAFYPGVQRIKRVFHHSPLVYGR